MIGWRQCMEQSFVGVSDKDYPDWL